MEIAWFVLEILLEFLGDLVFGALGDTVSPSTRQAWGAAFLLLLGGALLGLVSVFVLPERILPRPRTPGISLVVSPLLSGLAMHFWGSYRRDRGHPTTPLATFLGGASFAFGAALGRFFAIA